MKVILIHNKYKQSGGEDFVFHAEHDMLTRHGHTVECLVFNNGVIKTLIDVLASGLKAIYNPQSARALERKILQFNPDVIHVHNFLPLVSPSVFFVAGKFNIPVVLTLHNYRLVCPSATLFYKGSIYEKSVRSAFPFDAVLKGVYRNSRLQTAAVAAMTALHNLVGTWRKKVDLYIALTQFAREKFVNSALALPEQKVVVKPNSVADYGTGDEVRNDFFLFVGRLTEEKGVRTLLNATRLHNFRLVIIGDGPLADLVNEYALDNYNIHYLGFQEKPAIINYMKTCRALIFPSVWYEGLPITVLDAFSTGTVVIASRLGAMAEIIEDGINGVHFEAGNEKDLVGKIVEVSERLIDTEQLAANARLTYLKRYTPDKNYTMLIGAYRQALALKKQAHPDSVRRGMIPQLENT